MSIETAEATSCQRAGAEEYEDTWFKTSSGGGVGGVAYRFPLMVFSLKLVVHRFSLWL